MINITLLSQVRSMFKLDLKRRAILVMLFALFSTFYSQSQSGLTINTQPVKMQRVCIPSFPTNPRLQCAAVTCSGALLTYQWQRLRPASIGGTGLFEDIPVTTPGYTGANTPTIDITVADSITGNRALYMYRCFIVSSFPCFGTATTDAARIIGVRKPIVKYLTPLDTSVCEFYSGGPDTRYPLRARIIGVSRMDSLQYTWSYVDRPTLVDGPLSAHPNYTNWISTWTQSPDSTTLLNSITLNQANSTTIILNNDLNRYYLKVYSPACGIIDTNTVPKRLLVVQPVPNLTVNAPNPLNICKTYSGAPQTMSYTITNALRSAARGNAPINWTIDPANIVAGTGGTILRNLIMATASDTSGVGNVTRTITIPSGSWPTGTHTVNITGIRNYSVPANAQSCPRTLTSQDLTVNVYPNPRVRFVIPSTYDTLICQGSTRSIKIEVDSATFGVGGSNVSWTITTNGGAGLPATISGQGNRIGANALSYTTPNSLTVGTHSIILTGIFTVGTPSGSCTGDTIAGQSSRKLRVFPLPDATLNTTVTADRCAGSTVVSFSVTVSNAEFNGNPLNWSINYTDSTTGTIVGAFTGTGNQTIPFNTSAGLALGTHTIRLNSITLVSPSPVVGAHPTCSRTLVGQRKDIRVYPNPSASLSSVYGSACQNSGTTSFNMVVSGANYPPNLAWTITTSGTFKSPTDSSSSASTALTSVFATTGSGNATYTFTPPSNLAPGRYELLINSIALTNTPNCTTPLTLKYTLDIFPKPTAAIFGTTMTGNMCEGDVVNYSIAIGNAYYGPTGAGALTWSLNFTNTLGGSIPGAPIGGSGNGVLGSYNSSSSLLTGIYNLTLLTNTNTIPAFGTCVRSLAGDTLDATKLLRRVYPKPTVTASSATVNLCEGTAGSFNVTIDNAQRYGSTASADSMQWTLSTTGTFQAAPAGSTSNATLSGITFPTSGKGNNIVPVNLPNTLAPGQYIFTLGNPTLASAPSCVGSGVAPYIVTVNVWPKPTLLITPSVDTSCQGVSKPYTVTIGNAYYQPTPTTVSWSAPYVNQVGAGVSPSIANGAGTLTGSGNNMTTYNSAAINTPGTYKFIISNLNNTTHSCNYTTADTFVLIVKQRPRLVLQPTIPTEVCYLTGAVVTYDVDSVAPGQAWSFTYTALNTTAGASPITVSGVGPVNDSTFTTPNFNVTGAGTITFSPIALTASGGCVDTNVVSTINLSVAGIPDVTSTTISGASTICGNAFPAGVQKVDFDITTTNMIVGASTKNWRITYKITGTQDTSAAAGNQIFMQTGLTATGTGNGTFTLSTPNQTYNGTSADAGLTDVRTIIIQKIEYIAPGTTIFCSNTNIADSIATFNVNPRPRFAFNPANPAHVCVTSPIVLGFNVWGLASGQSGSFNWSSINPNAGVNNQGISGPSPISGSITTGNTVMPGFNIVTVSGLINSTTGCAMLTPPTSYIDSTIVDPPSLATQLDSSFTVCEGNNSGTLFLKYPPVGNVTKWQFSLNDGFTWLDYANTDTFHTFVNDSLTRRWRVIVKNLTCPPDTSNEEIVFVHPRPKVQIASFTSGICVGDTVSITLTVTGVPTSNSWNLTYTKAGFAAGNGSGTFTGTGSGTFIYKLIGLSTAASTGTIQLNIGTNNTTGCNNTFTSSTAHKMTILVGANSTAGSIGLDGVGSLPQTVCKNSSGNLRYLGSGNVLMWYYNTSVSPAAYPTGWDSITNSTYTQAFVAISQTTHYKVRVKFGSCSSVMSSNYTLNVRALPTATITGSDTICEGSTASFTITLNGEANSGTKLTWLEGSTGKNGNFTLGATPPTNFTLTTGALTATTSIVLQSIEYTAAPTCVQPLYTNAIATAQVNPNPAVTINTVTTPVCQGSTSTVTYTVSSVLSSTSWKLTYKVGSTTLTATGTGPGTYSLNTPALSTSGSTVVELVSIETTSLLTNCTNTLSGVTKTITVDATTTAGSAASDVTICKGGSATVTFTPGNGIINKWNVSTSGAAGTYSSYSSTTNTFDLTNITTNTWVTATSRNGVCLDATTAAVAITVRDLPTASISGSTTVCDGSTATLTIAVSNTYGNTWSITYLEGTASKTKTGTGDGSVTITTSALTTNTDITLQSITMTHSATSSNPVCGPTTLTSTVTVNVNANPSATLNSVSTPVCQGSTSSFSFTVSSVPTGQAWILTYNVGASTGLTTTGVSSGTFTVSTPTLSTAGTIAVTLTNIATTSLTPNCNTNLSGTANITVDATTVAGTIAGAVTVCKGSNSGTLTYTPATGALVRWEYSINAGSTWSATGTTSNTLSFSNLTQTTLYRVIAKNGSCSEAASASIEVTVREYPMATISGSKTICQYDSTTLTVAVSNSYGNTWSLTYLEGITSKTKTGTGDGNFTINSSGLNAVTDFTLQSITLTHSPTSSNPSCGPTTLSSTATVQITAMPNATLNGVNSPICQVSTSSFQFTVSNLNTTQGWSLGYTEAGSSKTTTGTGPGTYTIATGVLNTVGANTITLNSISTTGLTPNCTRSLSGQTATITVDATTVAGTIAGAVTVCKGTNSGTLTYSGGNGTIVRWEYSINGGSTWSTTGTTASTYSFSNLTQTTLYRVTVKNSACLEAISASIEVTVRDLPMATLSGSNTVCEGTSGSVTVTVTNTFTNPWLITFLEGTTTRTLTGSGNGTFTLTTLTLSSNTDITLQSIVLTHTPSSTNPGNCENTLTSTATVNVIPLPNATLNSVTTPICQGSTSTISFTVDNLATGQAWSMSFTEAGVSRTTTGSGPGTFTISTLTLNTPGANVVTLNSITITSSSPTCTRTLSGQTMTITVDATTVAGTIAGASTVCKGTNSGTLTYSGGNGTIVRWEYSINGGTTWSTTGSTASTLSFSNLTQTTLYRVTVKNSSCLEAISASVTITVRDLPTATLSGSNTVCQGTTGSVTVTVSNSFSNPWSIGFLEGTTSRTLTGTGDGNFTLTTLTLSTNTDITLQSIVLTHTPSSTNPGNCANTLTSTATVNVIPLPNATINSVTTPVCQGSTSSFAFTVSNIATGQAWSMSYTEAGTSKTATGNGPGTYSLNTSALNTTGANDITLNSITITSSSPNCTRTLSGQTMTITVDATTVAGTIAGAVTICKGSNSGTLTYSGGNGTIVRWEYSLNGTTWNTTGTTASTLNFSNLTQTTQYRVVVKNSSCLEAISAAIEVTVRDLPMATISGSSTVCQNTTGTLTVTVSNSFGNPWSLTFLEGTSTRTLTGTGDGNFTLTTLSLSTNTDITLQSILLTQSGTSTNPACGPNSLSSTATVNVIPLPNATLNSVKTPVCQGSTSAFAFTVSNIATGQAWSMSYTEGGVAKTSTGSGPGTYSLNTSSLNTPGKVSITLGSITITSSTPTCTRTLTGATDTIIVDATTVAGTISGTATVCKGSNSGTLTYSGGNGAIVRWEYSINGGSTWSSTGTTASTYNYSNLTQTTDYRVIVKNSSCSEAISTATTITVREQPMATISGSTTICQGTTASLTVTVSNSFGNPWSITYLEGTSTFTLTGSGDGNNTLTTATLSSTSDITLVSIQLTHSGTSTNPACGPNSLTSTATVNVTPLPTATLNKVVSPICQGNTSSFEFTVSNLSTGQGWSLSYTEGSTSKTTTGNGPGTYTVSTSTLSTAGTVTITLNSISTTSLSPNCTRTLTGQTMDITVNATTTVGTLGSDVTVCKNSNSGNLSYNVGSSNGAVVRWESSVISAAGPWTSITNTTNSQAYLNISQTTYYRVVVKNGTCAEKESNVITISVQEIPVATIGGSTTICAGNTSSLSISISNVAAGQRSILTYLEGTTSKTVSIFGSSGTITTSVLNTNTDITLVSVTSIDSTISATFRKGCANNSLTSTATINVNALPTVTLTSVGGPICQGNATTYTVTVTNVPTGQGWSLTGTIEGVSISPSPTGTGSGTFSFNTTVLNTPTSAEVKFTLVSNTTTGCTRTVSESKNIKVDATTTVGTISGSTTVCKGSNAGSLTYTAGSSNGTIVRWEYSTVSSSTNFNGISNTSSTQTYSNLTATTWYRAIVKNGECAEVASNVQTIIVRDLPNATISGSSTICEGSSANFTITVSNSFGQTFRVYYLIGSKLDSLERTGDGTYTINTGTLTSTTSITLLSIRQISGAPQCSQTLSGTITITVNDLPRASYTSVPTRLCQGSSIQFTIDVSKVKTSQNWTLSYNVKAPSSSGGTNESSSNTGSGTYTINTTTTVLPTTSTLTLGTITNNTTGCSTTLTDVKVIDVDATTVGGTTSGTATVCKGANSGTITLASNTGAVIRWEFSTNGGSTWTSISNTSASNSYSNLTQTTIFRAVVMNGVCNAANSSNTTITVNELPVATVNNATICASTAASLSVVVSNTFGQSWTLSFVEGSTSRTLTGTGDGTFTLTTGVLTATTTISLKSIQITTGTVLCSNTLSGVGVVTVNSLPTVTHDSAPSSVCDGSSVDFTVNVNDVVAGQGWTVNYRINTSATNTKSGTGPGNFSITSPVFTNSTSTMRVDNIELTSITNTTTGCSRTASLIRTIEVYPKSVGGTTASTVNPLCANTVTTSDITVSGFIGKVVRWEYSDDNQTTWTTLSNTSTTITVSNLAKTRDYRAVIQSGPCLTANSTITKIVVIPTVDAIISGSPVICVGKTAVFNVLVSNIASNDNWSMTYRVNGVLQTAMTGKGPGNYPLTVGAPTTNTAGTIIVKLETISNTTYNCANNNLSSQATAVVNPNPVANFTFTNSCKDSVAVFNNTSTIASGSIADYNWNFGDGGFSKNGNPTHAYLATGNYSVSLLAISGNGCRDSITKTITVNPRPIADFTTRNICQDTAARFVDGSSIGSGGSIKSRFWDFGDGSTSTLTNPTHKYIAAGTYNVTLTVVSNNGCASVISHTVTIFNLPEPNFVGVPVCQNSPMKFSNTSSIGSGAISAYKWDFAGQGNSANFEPAHTFTGFGSFNVSLTATSDKGCVKTLIKPVTVWANPIANFTVADVCIGDVSRFVNTSTMPVGSTDNIQENYWTFGDSSFSTGKDPVHVYAKDGVYGVTVRATSDKGCVNSVTKTAYVSPLPIDTITTATPKFCDGFSSVLNGNVRARSWEWSVRGSKGDSVIATTRSVTVTKQGWYKLRVTDLNPGGSVSCKSEGDSIFITVWQLPVADAGRDTLIDKGQSVVLNGRGAGLNGSYAWSPSTYLNNAAIQRPVSTPDETTIYSLTVTDRNGCVDSDTVKISVRAEFDLIVRNVVTPNGDGLNDTWIIENIEAYPTAEVAVFNRYGMEVFKTTGYKNATGWDGTNKLSGGKDIPDGAYFYVITLEGSSKVYTGAINLIRSEVK